MKYRTIQISLGCCCVPTALPLRPFLSIRRSADRSITANKGKQSLWAWCTPQYPGIYFPSRLIWLENILPPTDSKNNRRRRRSMPPHIASIPFICFFGFRRRFSIPPEQKQRKSVQNFPTCVDWVASEHGTRRRPLLLIQSEKLENVCKK